MKLDPRGKLLWIVGIAVIIFSAKSLIYQVIIFVIIVLASKLIFRSSRKILKPIRYLLILLPITFLIHLLSSTNSLSLNNLALPAMFTLRLGNFFLLMGFSLQWINAIELLDSIYIILRPLKRLKLPVDDLFQVIFLAVRFFPLVKEEYLGLDEGWRSFAKGSENSIKKRILNVRNRLIPLMIFSFRKAETIADSMVIRGYGSVNNRSYYSNLKFETKDIIFIFIGIAFLSSIYFSNIL